MTAEQPRGPAPDTKTVVLRYLRGEQRLRDMKDIDSDPGPGRLFGDVQKLGVVELSPPTLIQHPVLGWTWLACLRIHPPGKLASDYALFLGAESIRDARLSVVADGCATRSYELLGEFSAPAKKEEGRITTRSDRLR
jgi:hypothetical protein